MAKKRTSKTDNGDLALELNSPTYRIFHLLPGESYITGKRIPQIKANKHVRTETHKNLGGHLAGCVSRICATTPGRVYSIERALAFTNNLDMICVIVVTRTDGLSQVNDDTDLSAWSDFEDAYDNNEEDDGL